MTSAQNIRRYLTLATLNGIALMYACAANNRLVWDGAATGRVTETMRDNLGETVDTLVAAILVEFP